MEFIAGAITGIVISVAVKYFWPQEKQIALSEYTRLKERVQFLENKYGL